MQSRAAGFDKEYDVVIVGGGGAGLAAAGWASELGLKAIVLEKTGLLGGSSLLCGGQFCTFDIFYNDMNKTGKGMKEQKVVEAFVNISKIQYDFLTKTLDVHPRGVMAAPGMSVPHSHTFNPPEVIKTLTKYAKLKLS